MEKLKAGSEMALSFYFFLLVINDFCVKAEMSICACDLPLPVGPLLE